MNLSTKFSNRYEAGILLAEKLAAYRGQKDVIVLALPRGGVPVAYEIAKALQVTLDLLIVRKLGVPDHEELAFGAIAANDVTVLNHDLIHELCIPPSSIKLVLAKESNELLRREQVYRQNKPFPNLTNKTIILVDDGIATGASVKVAVKALHAMSPKKIIIAVPVLDKAVRLELESEGNEIISVITPDHLLSVGQWYDNFTQTEDEEVHQLMRAASANH